MRSTLVCLVLSVVMQPAFVQTMWGADSSNQYLALGDSLAFGLNPLIQPPNLSEYIAYPKIVAAVRGYALTNASCPGETASTFTGASDVFYPGYNCTTMEQQNQLYVPYNGAANQLAYAVAFLTANPGTSLVTIDIGFNNLAILLVNCESQYSGNQSGFLSCLESGLPTTLTTVETNLVTIFSSLRATGYTGPIVALNAFIYDYTNTVEVDAVGAYNTIVQDVGAQYSVPVANIYQAFQQTSAAFGGSPCEAGLLIRYSSTTCDTHPNGAGQTLIAATVLQTLAQQSAQ